MYYKEIAFPNAEDWLQLDVNHEYTRPKGDVLAKWG
jgi:hypothetical protein